jgi:bacterial/archaeal transporter family-2 protein
VDRLGIGPAGPQRLTTARIAGAGIAIIAVLIAVGNHIANPSSALIAVLPAIAGAGSAWQQAVNGRVRSATQSVGVATQINFIMGTSALAIALAIDLLVHGLPDGHLPTNPVYYLGGCVGVVFIAIAAAVVHEIGVLLLGLSMVAGQLIGAVGIDIVAPGFQGRPDLNTLIGVALTLVAVGVASQRPRRASETKQEVSVG